MLDLRFCTRAFSSCGERGPLFVAVCGPFTVAASLVAEHRLQSRRLSSSGPWAQLLRGMWDPPRPGLEPTSPALAGRLSTTAPPGKPLTFLIFLNYHFIPLLPVSNSFPFRCHYEPLKSYVSLSPLPKRSSVNTEICVVKTMTSS